MPVYAFYCPKCKKYSDLMKEHRSELLEYDVVIAPPTEKHLLYDIEYNQRASLDSETLAAECINCGAVFPNYSAEDFAVIYNPKTKEILDYGIYFCDHPEDLPHTGPQ